MPRLNDAEIARRETRAAEAARAQAMIAWRESWRMPLRGDIAVAMGVPRNYLNQLGLREVVDIEFGKVIDLQILQIMSTAQAMLNACEKGNMPVKKLNLSELERRLGCSTNMIAAHALKPRHRFNQARRDVLELWEKPQKTALPQTEGIPETRFCRCCNTSIAGKRTIDGYLPECWAEGQRWRLIDEGKLARVA